MIDFVTRCKTCRHPLAPQINEWLKAGMSTWAVAKKLEAAGLPITQPAILNHRKRHLTSEFVAAKTEAVKQMVKQQQTMPGPSKADLETLVLQSVTSRVESGDLLPGVRDALDVIKIRDAREARGKDENLAIRLALILGGATRRQIVEGEYVELDPEAEEDYAAVRLLSSGAPAA